MFTGIITDIGEVMSIEGTKDKTLSIKTSYDLNNVSIGDSIACNGACMTVTKMDGNVFYIDVSSESIAKTTIDNWDVGTRINLEKALCAGQPFGGHYVTGHIDSTAEITNIFQENRDWIFQITPQQEFMAFMAPKGSVTIDGVSLTINKSDSNSFYLCIIPHTMENTIFDFYEKGQKVNMEIDIMARYISHYLEKRS